MNHHRPTAIHAWAAWIAFAAILGLAAPSQAQEPEPIEETLETARGLGMGSGARASALGTSAVAYNPANLSLGRLYHVESVVGYVPGEGSWSLGGAVADSVSNRIAAGLSFRGIFGDGNRPYSGYDGRLALGLPLSEAIGVGVSARYIDVDPDGQSPCDGTDDTCVDERPGVSGFTLDTAIRVTPTEGLNIVALGYNLVDRNSALTPTLLGGSVSFGMEEFSIGADLLVDLTTFDGAEYLAGAGAEYLVAGQVPLRLGYRHDTGRGLRYVTGAIGYTDNSVGLDLGLRQGINGDKDTQLVFSFRYHVQ